MAELHVQKKRNSYIWFWVVLITLVVLSGMYYYLHYYNPKAFPVNAKPGSSMRVKEASALV